MNAILNTLHFVTALALCAIGLPFYVLGWLFGQVASMIGSAALHGWRDGCKWMPDISAWSGWEPKP